MKHVLAARHGGVRAPHRVVADAADVATPWPHGRRQRRGRRPRRGRRGTLRDLRGRERACVAAWQSGSASPLRLTVAAGGLDGGEGGARAVYDQVGVVAGLAQAAEQVEDVRVVVQQRALSRGHVAGTHAGVLSGEGGGGRGRARFKKAAHGAGQGSAPWPTQGGRGEGLLAKGGARSMQVPRGSLSLSLSLAQAKPAWVSSRYGARALDCAPPPTRARAHAHLGHVGVEAGGGAHVEGLVEVALLLVQCELHHLHAQRRQFDLRADLLLGAAELAGLKHVTLEREHGALALAHEAAALDGVDHVRVEVAIVPHGRVIAVDAAAAHGAEAPAQRLAAAALVPAEVVGEGRELQEAYLRKQWWQV